MEHGATKLRDERRDEKETEITLTESKPKSKSLGRRRIDEILDKVTKPSSSSSDENEGDPKPPPAKIPKYSEEDVREEMQEVKKVMERLDKSLDVKFAEVRSEIRQLSDNFESVKAGLDNDVIIPDIKAVMTSFARHDFANNFVQPKEDVYYPFNIKTFSLKKLD